MHLLDNYIFSSSMRYESHRFYINCPGDEDAFVFGGILGAALAAVSLVDTEEGNARGIRLYTDEEKEEFFARYDREVLHDDWGYLTAEIDQLHDAYVQLVVADVPLSALFPNVRLLNLALDLMMSYMHRLALEQYREHIWDLIPWTEPFAQWLWSASQVERCRQRYLQADWSNLVEVISMVDNPEPEEGPLFVFVGEEAEDIMSRYLEWLNGEYVAMKQEIPGAKITNADRKYIYAQETDWAFLSDEIDQLDASEQKEWNRWQQEWSRFLSERLLPMKEIRFWADDVPEEIQEHLLYHLQLAEQHPAHFRDLTTAVYAMRQLGYIRRKCPDRDIRQWLSEHLKLDYTERNNASQFRRAMKEHGRYTPEVRDEVILLESMGYFRFQTESSE